MIESLVAVSSGEYIDAADIELPGSGGADSSSGVAPGMTMREMEKELIRSTLALTEGNREQAAKVLQIGERTLYRKIKQYDL